ncbi:DUF3995 domain-containing protein [Turneriella parva]|nr:DUF3995 domain-containing protein [Turneriella parva]
MNLFSGIPLFIIFVGLSVLHVYWAFGGRWGSESVLPTKDMNTVRPMPGALPTLIVAAGLLLFACMVFARMASIRLPVLSDVFLSCSMWLIFSIFLLRAIGDFRYFGLFKRVRHTKFGINDTRFFTPLCLLIAVLALLLGLQ